MTVTVSTLFERGHRVHTPVDFSIGPSVLIDRLLEMSEWCAANLDGKMTSRYDEHKQRTIWYFENEEDAVLFSLRWLTR